MSVITLWGVSKILCSVSGGSSSGAGCRLMGAEVDLWQGIQSLIPNFSGNEKGWKYQWWKHFFFLTLSVLHSSVFHPHRSTHSQLMAARFSVGQRLEAFNNRDLGLRAGGTHIWSQASETEDALTCSKSMTPCSLIIPHYSLQRYSNDYIFTKASVTRLTKCPA